MESVDTAHLQLIESADNARKIAGLSGVLQFIAEGNDVSRFSRPVIQHCLTRCDHRNVRKLAYDVLRSCEQSVAQWESIAAVLVQDLLVEDIELRLYSLRMLASLPPSSLKFVLSSCSPIILNSLSAKEPFARGEAVIAIVPLLLPPTVHSIWDAYHQFVTDAWTLIAKLLVDDEMEVIAAASHAVHMAVRGSLLAWTRPEHTHPSEAATREIVTAFLVQHFYDIMARVSVASCETDSTYAGLACALAAIVPRKDEAPLSEDWRLAAQLHPRVERLQLVVHSVLLPRLALANPGVVSETAMLVLQVAELLEGLPACTSWRQEACGALLGLLDSIGEGLELSAPFIEAACAAATRVHDAGLASRCLRAASRCRDDTVRLCSVYQVCFSIQQMSVREHERTSAVAGARTATPFLALNEQGLNLLHVSREMEEVCCCLLTALLQLEPASGAPPAAWIAAALDSLRTLSPCVLWHVDGRTVLASRYVDVLLHVCSLAATNGAGTQDAERLHALLQALDQDSFNIRSDLVRSQLLYVLAVFLARGAEGGGEELVTLTANLKRRMRHEDSFEHAKQLLASVAKSGQLGAPNIPIVDVGVNMEVTLQSVFALALRCSSLSKVFLDELDTFAQNSKVPPTLVASAFNMAKRVRAFYAGNAIDKANAFVPRTALSPPDALMDETTLVANRTLADNLQRAVHCAAQGVSAFRPATSRLSAWGSISGGSDAIHIACRHEADARTRTAHVYVQLVNITDVEIPAFSIRFGLGGSLAFMQGVASGVVDVDGLAPMESREISLSCVATRYCDGQLFVRLQVQGFPSMIYKAYTLPAWDWAVPVFWARHDFRLWWSRAQQQRHVAVSWKAAVRPAQLASAVAATPFRVLSMHELAQSSVVVLMGVLSTCFDDHVGFRLSGSLDHERAMKDGEFGVADYRGSLVIKASTDEAMGNVANDLDGWIFRVFGGQVARDAALTASAPLVPTIGLLPRARNVSGDATVQSMLQRWGELKSARAAGAAAAASVPAAAAGSGSVQLLSPIALSSNAAPAAASAAPAGAVDFGQSLLFGSPMKPTPSSEAATVGAASAAASAAGGASASLFSAPPPPAPAAAAPSGDALDDLFSLIPQSAPAAKPGAASGAKPAAAGGSVDLLDLLM